MAEWQFPFRDTGNFAENGVSLHGTAERTPFPVSDTGNLAENGVSLRGIAEGTPLPVRDTGNPAKKGVSLHGTSARNLGTEPLHEPSAQNRGTG